jgi:hypothetical protein
MSNHQAQKTLQQVTERIQLYQCSHLQMIATAVKASTPDPEIDDKTHYPIRGESFHDCLRPCFLRSAPNSKRSEQRHGFALARFRRIFLSVASCSMIACVHNFRVQRPSQHVTKRSTDLHSPDFGAFSPPRRVAP